MDELGPFQRLAAIARDHGGCFTRRAALASGVTPARLRTLRERGLIEEVWHRRGVYRVAAVPRTWESGLHAAALLAAGRGVVSHRSAARWWGLFGFDRNGALDILLRSRKAPRSADGVTFHLTGWLPDDHVTDHRGLTTTTASRTIPNLAPYVADDRLFQIALDAWRRKLTDPEALATCARQLGRTRGVASLWEVIGRLDEDALGARSVPEVDVHLALLKRPSIPGHVLDHEVRFSSGRRVLFDVAWPDLLAAVEIDSERFHTTGYDRARDTERQEDAEREGWVVLRITVAELADMDRVMGRIERFLDEAAATVAARAA